MGMVLSTTISYSLAETLINSKDVTYEDNSGLGATNVQAAIDGTCTKFSNQLTNLQTTILNKVYPVGSIYTSTNNTNPGTLFGGTWIAFGSGKTLVGVSTGETEFNTVEKTGGAKTFNNSHTHTIPGHTHTTGNHTLTIAEMPSHTHEYTTGRWIETEPAGKWYIFSDDTHTTLQFTRTTTATGGNQPHNHGNTGSTALTTDVSQSTTQSLLQPYITVYFFKRTK